MTTAMIPGRSFFPVWASDLISFIDRYPWWLPAWILSWLVGPLIWRHFRGPRFPKQSTVSVVFKELFASGSSHRNILTRFGGASRCLTVVVTTEELWITTFFPFTALAGFYDLEHRIALNNILSAIPNGPGVILEFRRENGKLGKLGLYLRDQESFLRSLGLRASG